MSFAPERIISKLREAEVLLSQGSTVAQASRKIGLTEQTYYRWRKEYGGSARRAVCCHYRADNPVTAGSWLSAHQEKRCRK
jgi:hypothetical protein